MRLLFVVQRYGREVAGGAEFHCREFAARLALRGHLVEVLTSCAVSYVDWANDYAPGSSELDGVQVHRLPVTESRDPRLFGELNSRVVWGRRPVPLYLQREWMRRQGPDLRQLPHWLRRRAMNYDAVIFFTYLYYPTWAGLPATSGLAPTLLHPTAHDEPSLGLPLFRLTFRYPDAFAFSTKEEAALVHRQFGTTAPSAIIGIGVEMDPPGDEAAFRRQYGLGTRPYLLFVGRVEPGKGSEELFEFFTAYKRRNPGPLLLVIVGQSVKSLPPHPDLVCTGFVSEEMKHGALAGAVALVQPSFFESFSLVLTEAWAAGRPVLAQGHCEVLAAQVRRANGGIPYRGYAEFEAAVELLAQEPDLARELGHAGHLYVASRYSWDRVLGDYETLLDLVSTGPRSPDPDVRGIPCTPAPAGASLEDA